MLDLGMRPKRRRAGRFETYFRWAVLYLMCTITTRFTLTVHKYVYPSVVIIGEKFELTTEWPVTMTESVVR